MQARAHSLVESCTNVLIGYLVACLSQMAIFPMFGIHVPIQDNFIIGLWFTAISIVRSYTIRRVFTRRTEVFDIILQTIPEAVLEELVVAIKCKGVGLWKDTALPAHYGGCIQRHTDKRRTELRDPDGQLHSVACAFRWLQLAAQDVRGENEMLGLHGRTDTPSFTRS